MFFQFEDDIISTDVNDISDNSLTIGYVSGEELLKFYKGFGIPIQAVEMCTRTGTELLSGIEVYENCFFIRLSIINNDYHTDGNIGIFVLKNFMLLVNIGDSSYINRDLLMKLISRANNDSADLERVVISLFEGLVIPDDLHLDDIRRRITDLEESVIRNNADKRFNIMLLKLKREILSYRGYYERLIDIAQVLVENDNELFDCSIRKLNHFTDKAKRLKDSVDILTDSVVHLWDAYQASLEMRLNETMKIFTLVTTVFFPLTVIVGWYGMNFDSMPEFKWKYGYAYVIALSISVVMALVIYLKRKRWI